MFAWSRNFYAKWHDIIFCFEAKVDRDFFVAHCDAIEVSFKEAYDHKNYGGRIKVCYSQRLGANPERKKTIKEWKDENKRRLI